MLRQPRTPELIRQWLWDEIILDGTKSSDVNGQPLSYSWSFVTIPNGSTASLSGIRSPTPSFIADEAGSYILGLVVNDGTLSSSQSTLTITTRNTPPVAVGNSYAADRYRERPRAPGRSSQPMWTAIPSHTRGV